MSVAGRRRGPAGKLSQRLWSLGLSQKASVAPGCPHPAHQRTVSLSHTVCPNRVSCEQLDHSYLSNVLGRSPKKTILLIWKENNTKQHCRAHPQRGIVKRLLWPLRFMASLIYLFGHLFIGRAGWFLLLNKPRLSLQGLWKEAAPSPGFQACSQHDALGIRGRARGSLGPRQLRELTLES